MATLLAPLGILTGEAGGGSSVLRLDTAGDGVAGACTGDTESACVRAASGAGADAALDADAVDGVGDGDIRRATGAASNGGGGGGGPGMNGVGKYRGGIETGRKNADGGLSRPRLSGGCEAGGRDAKDGCVDSSGSRISGIVFASSAAV